MNADVRRGSTREKERSNREKYWVMKVLWGLLPLVPTELLTSSEAELSCLDKVKAKKVKENLIRLTAFVNMEPTPAALYGQ